MEDKKVLLSVRDLSVKFRVRGRILTAIRDVSLDIYENETIAIVGESGCGKSVFTKTFAGTLDNNGFIDQGDIIFNDEDLNDIVFPLNDQAKRFIEYETKRLNRFAEAKGAISEDIRKQNERFAKEIYMSVHRYPTIKRPGLVLKIEKGFRAAYDNGEDLTDGLDGGYWQRVGHNERDVVQ